MKTIKGLLSECCNESVKPDKQGIIYCTECGVDCICVEVQRKKKKIKVAGRDLSEI